MTVHSHAWTDFHVQTGGRVEGRKQVRFECHTPLSAQRRYRVLGYHRGNRWNAVVAVNPAFEPVLRRQGAVCAAHHIRHGVVYRPFAELDAPHLVARWNHENEACVRCHVVNNCHNDGYGVALSTAALATPNCVQCHMPSVNRPLVSGGAIRPSRRHRWRGGHGPRMVRDALSIRFARLAAASSGRERYAPAIASTGAEHHIPTSVPDRASGRGTARTRFPRIRP